jgi:hypothetical protein
VKWTWQIRYFLGNDFSKGFSLEFHGQWGKYPQVSQEQTISDVVLRKQARKCVPDEEFIHLHALTSIDNI